MGQKGVAIGDSMDYYHPIHARFSPLEGIAAKQIMGTPEYHRAIGKAGAYVGGALKPAMGVTMGEINQLRQMEKLGMTPTVDKALKFISEDAKRMQEFIHLSWNGVKNIPHPVARAEAFSQRLMERAVKNKMNTRMRLGIGKSGEEALRQVSSQLDSVSGNPQRLKDKIAGIADVLVRPAQYDMRPVNAARRYITQMSSSYAYQIGRAHV